MRALFFVCLVAATVVLAQEPHRCSGRKNQFPVYTGAPVLKKTVPNGKLYEGGNPATNSTFLIAHLWGTPTEQGTAYGTLLKDQIAANYQNFLAYLEAMAEHAASFLPKWLVDLVVQNGAEWLLDLTFNATQPFTPQRYIDEVDAIAAASGYSQKLLRGLSTFPEAIEAQCTIILANGNATANGGVSHARFLDFGNATIRDLPLVVVYHNGPEENDQLNLGWVGFTGMLTGAARVKPGNSMMSLGEKVWDAGNMWTAGVYGEPWTWMTRDAMRQKNMAGVLRTYAEGKRTCRIWIGVGHDTANGGETALMNMDAKEFNVFNWQNLTGSPWPGHPNIADVAYVDKHMQPSHNPCLGELLTAARGQLSAEYLATEVSGIEQSGDIHAATFDDRAQTVYFSTMKKTWDTGSMPINAYDRPWTKLDARALFDEAPPSP